MRTFRLLCANTLTEFFVPILVLVALQNLDAPADTVLRVPVLVVVAVLFDSTDALAKVNIPNLGGKAYLLVADAFAKLAIPVEPNRAFLGLALARACSLVPVVARGAQLRPFAGALALLPIPVLIVEAVLLLHTLALAYLRIPDLTSWASLEDWAHTVAGLEAEIIGSDALNGLLAIAFAGLRVPDPRPLTRGDLCQLPARQRLKDD